MAQSLELLLIQFLMPDNDARRQTEDQIKGLSKDPQVISALVHHTRTAKTPNARQLSAVPLCKKITGYCMTQEGFGTMTMAERLSMDGEAPPDDRVAERAEDDEECNDVDISTLRFALARSPSPPPRSPEWRSSLFSSLLFLSSPSYSSIFQISDLRSSPLAIVAVADETPNMETEEERTESKESVGLGWVWFGFDLACIYMSKNPRSPFPATAHPVVSVERRCFG